MPGEDVEGAQRRQRGLLDTTETAVRARGTQGLGVRLADWEGQADLRAVRDERDFPHNGRSELDAAAHQQPMTRSACGKRGPSGGAVASWATSGHATLGAKSSKGKLCLSEEGPMPRVTEREQSAMACSAAASMGEPTCHRCSCLAREKYCSGTR